MGRAATMSVMGLYNWDNTLFDLFEIPEALDKDTLIVNLLAETAELEVLYANPVVMKNLIAVWSRKNLDVWTRLWKTTQYEYDPIENYNRMEEGTDGGSSTTSHSGTDGRTASSRDGGTETEETATEVTGSGTGKAEHYKAAFDSTASGDDDGLVKETRDDTENELTENGEGSRTTKFGKTNTVTESKTYGEQVQTQNDGQHMLHAHGNIGVTTTQEMIRQQRNIERFNLYDIIIDEFKMRFCILVY